MMIKETQVIDLGFFYHLFIYCNRLTTLPNL